MWKVQWKYQIARSMLMQSFNTLVRPTIALYKDHKENLMDIMIIKSIFTVGII